MDRHDDGSDYIVIDNFAEYFKLDKADLKAAKLEAENVTALGCNAEGSTQRGARCDALTWMAGLGEAGEDNPHLRKIYNSVEQLRPVMNGISGSDAGDNTLRVDEQELVLSR